MTLWRVGLREGIRSGEITYGVRLELEKDGEGQVEAFDEALLLCKRWQLAGAPRCLRCKV